MKRTHGIITESVTGIVFCTVILAAALTVSLALAQDVVPERKVADVDPKIYDLYVGQYQLAPNFIISISKEKNRLFAQATGQAKIEIFPESDKKFFYIVVDAKITFTKNEEGKVTGLTLHQNGRDMPADKIADTIPIERKAIQLDPKMYNAYVGRYQITPDTELEITKDDGHLFARLTGQTKIEIYPESETKFFFTVIDAQITFKKDDNGKVTGLILHQGGDHHAKKLEE
ncbi:DUF3471 domain-containing protein [Candidatus Latescibacterota bacterium]